MVREPISFDFRRARTGGVCYEPSYSVSSIIWSNKRAAEVAASEMTLRQALAQPAESDYAELFDDTSPEHVTRALARSHAATGDPRDALAWAKRVGGPSAVTSRIYALVGVAEGILDRTPPTKAAPEPEK